MTALTWFEFSVKAFTRRLLLLTLLSTISCFLFDVHLLQLRWCRSLPGRVASTERQSVETCQFVDQGDGSGFEIC